jgi:3-hydroxyisobutyrate dehydrogenase
LSSERGSDVGFIGLGNMGWPMAHNLADAGIHLVVRDALRERQQQFADDHDCRAAVSAADFSAAAVTVTMLPDDQAVAEAVLRWDGGVASALAPGAVVVDMSSSNPVATRALGQELRARGIELIDAPVSGGIRGAAQGSLSVMVGSDDEQAFASAKGVLEVLGSRLFRTGPLGSGHAMKALNNYLGAAAYLTLSEALAIGKRFGLQPETMLEVINSSSGRSFNSEVVFAQDVVPGRYQTGFALGLLAKDVAIAAALASEAAIEAPACELVCSRWKEAVAGIGPSADHSEAHKQWQRDVTETRDNADERVPAGGS